MNYEKRKELVEKIANSSEITYIPIHIRDLIMRIYEYKQNKNEEVTLEEISEKFNISIDKSKEIDELFKKYLK